MALISNFYLKFVNQDQVFKEIKKSFGNKASRKKWYPNQNKGNINIIIATLVTPYLTLSF